MRGLKTVLAMGAAAGALLLVGERGADAQAGRRWIEGSRERLNRPRDSRLPGPAAQPRYYLPFSEFETGPSPVEGGWPLAQPVVPAPCCVAPPQRPPVPCANPGPGPSGSPVDPYCFSPPYDRRGR